MDTKIKINSNTLTFIDTTDTKKIDVHITANHPTVQIFDANKGTYTPNWNPNEIIDNVAGVPLKLSATVYADSLNVTDNKKYGTKYQWFKDKDFENDIGNATNELIISDNVLKNQSIVEYTCKATYNQKTYENKIVLTLITTGKNGTNGYTPQKGVDYFDGKNGQDGKSVGIKGVAYTNQAFSAGGQVILYSDPEYKNQITTGYTGENAVDGYLVDGYLCVYTGEHFIWTGKIQGPQGQKGESTFLYIRYADDQNGNGFDPSPVGKKYIGFYRGPEESLPNDINRGYDTWKWSKYVGDDAKSISLNASTQVFRVGKDGKISPEKLTITPHVVNTSIIDKLYSVNGNTFSTTLPKGLSIDDSNKITITGKSMDTNVNSIAIRMGDGTYSDTLTIYKVYDGDKGEDASVVFLTNENITFAADSDGKILGTTVYCDVVAYTGTTKVTPTVGVISSVDLPNGMSIGERTTEDNQVKIPIIIADNTTLGSTQSKNGVIEIPISSPIDTTLYLTWSKVNSGAKGETGVGIKSTTVWYGVSDSASTKPPESSWQSTIPTVADGKYLWTITVIDYTDGTDTITYTYTKQGVKGDTGSTGSSVTVSKIEYQAGTSATIAPTSTWSTSVVSVADGGYLWTKTTFSDGKVAYGVARQGANGGKGDKGDTGRGVSSIVEQYYQSTSATAQSGGSWSSTVPTWADGKYIWTRSVITYTDSASSTTSPICITGQKGATGSSGTDGVGISSVDVWYYQSSSATSLNGGSWVTTAPTWVDGKYIWTKTITTYTNNTTDETNAVCITGQRGSQGIQGPKGNDGQQYYTWVKYADTPTSGMSNDPDGKTYIGLAYNKTTATESTTYSDYAWSLIRGETGAVGPKGEDGQQYYTWIKYADNASGANMSDSPNGKLYIGLAYNKTTSTESNVASDYTWALFKGDKGDKGNDGVGIASTTVTYGVSDSSSTQPTSWQATIPTVAEGKYLWTRTVIDYTDTAKADTVSYTYTKQGLKGDTGSAGSSVTVTSIQYQEGTSATTTPTGNWSNSVVSVSDGNYLWTKTTFSDGKTAYGVAKQGSSGKGIKSVTEYYLATASSSGVTTSTSGWTTTIQAITVDKKYLWNYEVITYTNDTTSSTSPIIIGVFGNTGATGAAGKGIKSVTEYYLATASSSNITTSTSGWTTTMQTLTSAKKYLWNYELITYTDDTTSTVNPIIIGVYGDQGVAAVSFQVYAPNGYLLTKELDSLTLQTFAYEGSTAITSGVTYQWSQLIDGVWTAISGATSTTYTVTQADVLKAKSYRCVMTYKGQTYTSTVTVQDKTDIYNSVMCISSNATSSTCYWVLYTLVYSDTEEVDPLLGPISINAPTSPKSGDYWYAVNEANATVTLKKYNGTSWANSTDTQSLSYYWDIINNGSEKVPFGDHSKVQVVSCDDFTATATLMCGVNNVEDGLLTQSSLSLTDASDPIVSTTEPTSVIDGQIWIKPNNNGTYIMSIWDETNGIWVVSDMDTRTKVHTTKPSTYSVGDLWITASDTEHSGYLEGTLLMANTSSSTFSESHWSTTLKYDKDLDSIKETLNDLSQYVNITSDGLKISAQSASGEISPFTSLFTSTELAFYQNSDKLLTLANNQLTAPHIVVEDDLEVGKSISLGNLSLTIETNGSFSFAVQK